MSVGVRESLEPVCACVVGHYAHVCVCLFVCAYVRMCVQGIRVKPCEGHSMSVRPDLWRRDMGDG